MSSVESNNRLEGCYEMLQGGDQLRLFLRCFCKKLFCDQIFILDISGANQIELVFGGGKSGCLYIQKKRV